MIILLTGCAGFIGSNLAERLIKEGHMVLGIDNFNDYYDPKVKRFNIENLLNSSSFELFEGDITDSKFLDKIFYSWGVDSIIHLAAWAGVTQSFQKPVLFGEVNFMGTMNLLEMAKKYQVYDFVFASSSSVYGNSEKSPFKETLGVSRPISIYSATKKCTEVLAYTYSYQYGINVSALRFFNVYGPRQRPEMAIPLFTRKIYRNEEIPIFMDFKTSRDYTYIDDICDGVVKALDKRYDYEIFNLGNSAPIELKDLISTIETVMDKKARTKLLPRRRGEVLLTFADTSKSERMLGYNPNTKFIDGVRKYYDWFLKTPQWYKQMP